MNILTAPCSVTIRWPTIHAAGARGITSVRNPLGYTSFDGAHATDRAGCGCLAQALQLAIVDSAGIAVCYRRAGGTGIRTPRIVLTGLYHPLPRHFWESIDCLPA
ncbi:hypothetical protein MAHJHV64_40110 [Mycobacterium avium subsp. hominissuis]|uniref:Uncharacterized protein n=1 Tax=Mycobacterium avium subsp. hominissuis TaxID=439334 RepID=A0AAI8X2B1_MYCAV|nr:hypothetical protein JPH1_20850 [Mycobacterium avium subsp. hominissuis]